MSMLVSCISTKHSLLKTHWRESDKHTRLSKAIRGSIEKPTADLGGCLIRLAEDGTVLAQTAVTQPSGMLQVGEEILVAGRTSIHSFNRDLIQLDSERLSSPLFNALHTVRRSKRGVIIASTGLDLILEMNLQGTPLWQWWAHDHGFDTTPLGRRRSLNRDADFRATSFGTLQQATHVNSAIEAPDGRILATLFHQNMVIAIDRVSGAWQPIVTDVPHVHAARVLDRQHISVVDTDRGRLLIVDIRCSEVVTRLQLDTEWLQDGLYDAEHNRWLLVDGEGSRIIVRAGRNGEGAESIYPLEPEWRLYEVLSLN